MVIVIRTTFWAIGLMSGWQVTAADYDPLAAPESAGAQPIELTVKDEARKREVPLKVYLPSTDNAAPVVLFSHGLGGTRNGSGFLGKHWCARGYVAVFLQHPGSDDSVWKDVPLTKRMAAMKQAASGRNYLQRVQDVKAVLDQLEVWNKADQHPLAARLDLTRIGMSGHSFGAVTTQAVSGQSAGLAGQRFTDRRIKGAVILSPSTPRRGDALAAFGSVSVPWLLMTGTKDTAPIGEADLASRTGVYPHLPATIDKYELVLHNAEHSAFTDRALPGDKERRNPNHHSAILALSTAFWDAHLRGDAKAIAWLQGAGARSVLEEKDRWQSHAGQ